MIELAASVRSCVSGSICWIPALTEIVVLAEARTPGGVREAQARIADLKAGAAVRAYNHQYVPVAHWDVKACRRESAQL